MLIMFCLDPLHPLYTVILDAIAANPGVSVADLHAHLRKRRTNITLQHLYRTVNRLVEAQIVIKAGTRLSINLMWLSYLQFFAERAKKVLLEHRGSEIVFPLKEGERTTFTCNSLLDLQALWNHLLVRLHQAAPGKHLLKYYAHAWWQIGRYALDASFYRRITESGVRCHWLFGNTTFLDAYAAKQHKDLMNARLTDDPPFPKEGYNLNVYGSHIFECIFPERITKHFDFIFHTVTSIEQLDLDVYNDVFLLEAPLTLKVWRNEKQAAQLRARIERYFLRAG